MWLICLIAGVWSTAPPIGGSHTVRAQFAGNICTQTPVCVPFYLCQVVTADLLLFFRQLMKTGSHVSWTKQQRSSIRWQMLYSCVYLGHSYLVLIFNVKQWRRKPSESCVDPWSLTLCLCVSLVVWTVSVPTGMSTVRSSTEDPGRILWWVHTGSAQICLHRVDWSN